jgi:hypothetical protein
MLCTAIIITAIIITAIIIIIYIFVFYSGVYCRLLIYNLILQEAVNITLDDFAIWFMELGVACINKHKTSRIDVECVCCKLAAV